MVHALAAHHGDAAALTREALEREVLGDDAWLTVIVAASDTVLCGYAALTPMAQLQFGARGYDMHHLFVKPEHRGEGVGKVLIKACICHAKKQSCRFITVGTHPDNHAAQQVYLAAGFTQRPASGPRFSIKW